MAFSLGQAARAGDRRCWPSSSSSSCSGRSGGRRTPARRRRRRAGRRRRARQPRSTALFRGDDGFLHGRGGRLHRPAVVAGVQRGRRGHRRSAASLLRHRRCPRPGRRSADGPIDRGRSPPPSPASGSTGSWRMLTGVSRAEAAALVDDGAVRVDGAVVTSGKPRACDEGADAQRRPRPSAGGAARRGARPDVVVPRGPRRRRRDRGRQAGRAWSCTPAPGNRDGTLVHGLLARYPELAGVGRPGPARASCTASTRARRGCWSWPARRRPTRRWSPSSPARAVERALPGARVGRASRRRSGVIDAPIGRSAARPDPDGRVGRRAGRPAPATRSCATFDRAGAVSLLECRLETGRTHQIRVHLAAIGHPVVGDGRYGGAPARRRRARDRSCTPRALALRPSGHRRARCAFDVAAARRPGRAWLDQLDASVLDAAASSGGRRSPGQAASPRAMATMSARVQAVEVAGASARRRRPRRPAARTGPRGRRRRSGGARRSRRPRSGRRPR